MKKWKIKCEVFSRRGCEAKRAKSKIFVRDDLNLEIIFLLSIALKVNNLIIMSQFWYFSNVLASRQKWPDNSRFLICISIILAFNRD